MELFEFYKKIEEYQNQKNNILATVIEGENSGSRYFFSEGELIAAYGDGASPDEQLKEIAQAQQSRITEADGQKVFVEALKQPAHLVICRGRTCIAAGDPACSQSRFSCDSTGRPSEFCRRSEKNGGRSGDLRQF